MNISQLPGGTAVFLDANMLVHYFQPHPIHGATCGQLINRIETDQLTGFTSTQVLGEMAHRLMTLEARGQAGWSPGKVVQRLKQHPVTIQNLALFQTAVESVLQSKIQVIAVAPNQFRAAASLCRQFGLLTNDALVVAVMQAHGLTPLASADGDFDRVPGITRFGPG